MAHNSDPILLADPWGKWLHERFNSGPEGRMEGFGSIIEAGTDGINPLSSDAATRASHSRTALAVNSAPDLRLRWLR